MREEKRKLYNPVIDILRTISILAVILVHTTTKTLEASSYNLLNTSWTLFLNQAARFAVPMFFMISGFVLELNYHLHESYLTYLKKRFSRIFIPYLFWSIVYYFFVYYKGRDPNFISALLRGDASYQLYFIPSLLIFYLLFPIIHKYYKVIGNRWIIISLGLIELFLLFYDYNVYPIQLYYPITITLLNFFVFIFGVLLARNQERFLNFIKKWKIILLSGTVFFAIFIFYEGLNGYLKTHNYLTFYSQWRPSVLIYTILLAGSLYWIFNRKLKLISLIKTFSKLSFFVFFTHVIFLEILWNGFLKNVFEKSNNSIAQTIWYDPLYFLAVTVISFGVAFVIHKIPKLSKITG
jgi:surface polysaccharide O-acyltransferase-like enzyme